MLLRLLFVLVLSLGSFSTFSLAFELQPLSTRNLSPAAIGFGLPTLGSATVLRPQSGQGQLSFDLISNSTEKTTTTESLLFDGETYRLALSGDYGVSNDFEVGFEWPLISHQGGFLDSFIEGWHDTFGLPQGIRDETPRNHLDYSYTSQNSQGLDIQSAQTGLGDITLRGAWQLKTDAENMRAIALRASLKLPTGRAGDLTGSGSTDLAIWLSGEQRLLTGNGQLLFYGGGGGLISSNGDLLPEQRQNLVGFFSLGCGWQPWELLGLQVQFDGHTPFYEDSHLRELSGFAGQLAMGGSLELTERTTLELAVIEDVIVATAPDVVFHFALRQRF